MYEVVHMTSPATVDNPVANHVATMPGRNGGTLRNGGTNRGGTGRRPDRIKRMAQRDLAATLPHLKHFANGVAVEYVEDGKLVLISPTVGERIRAVEVMHKIGMGEQVAVSDVRARLKAQLRVIRDMMPPEQADQVCAALGEVWR